MAALADRAAIKTKPDAIPVEKNWPMDPGWRRRPTGEGGALCSGDAFAVILRFTQQR